MPASADSSQKLNHDAIAMARFFSGLLGGIVLPAQQLRQLRDVRGDAPGLVAGEEVRRRATVYR
jgi:hypothetical protein